MAAARGQLPKAYLRIDPNIDQNPDMPLIVRLMCAANRQEPRGEWKTWRHLVAAVGETLAAEAKAGGHVGAKDDGRWELIGWSLWQEGDLTVGDRMRSLRERKRQARYGDVTPTVTPGVTPTVTPVYTRAASLNRNALSEASRLTDNNGSGDSVPCNPCSERASQTDAPPLGVVDGQSKASSPNDGAGTRQDRVRSEDAQPIESRPGVEGGLGGGETAQQPQQPQHVAQQDQRALVLTRSGKALAKPKPVAATLVKTTWLTPYLDAWRAEFGGELPAKRAAAALAKPWEELGDEELLARWRRYLSATEAQFANPQGFASKVGAWADDAPTKAPRGRQSAEDTARKLYEWANSQPEEEMP